jgi:uncharacterized damage-inducible protein DinB
VILNSNLYDMNESHPTDSVLVKYTAYNLWANTQFAQWFGEASEDIFNQEIESSFNTIKQTLIHIWNAEYVWLQLLKQESMGDPPGKTFAGNSEELLNAVIAQSTEFYEFVSSMTDLELNSSREGSSGRVFSVADIIHHCMNHSTYHRGQLVTMGRQAGLKSPPRTDLIYYTSLKQD